MPVCTKATLIPESACYSGDIFDLHEQLALEVYFRLQTVNAIGGTNYVNDEDQLARDAQDLFGGVPTDQLRAMQLTILANNADASGAAISADPDTLAGFIAQLKAYPEAQLQRMNLFLQCLQGSNAPYPQ